MIDFTKYSYLAPAKVIDFIKYIDSADAEIAYFI